MEEKKDTTTEFKQAESARSSMAVPDPKLFMPEVELAKSEIATVSATTAEGLSQLEGRLAHWQEFNDRINAEYDPVIKTARGLVTMIRGLKALLSEPTERIIKAYKTALLSSRQAIEAEARAETERIQAGLREQAEAKKKQEAADLIAAGYIKQARALRGEPVRVPTVQAAPPPAMTQNIARVTWSAEVTDLRALLEAGLAGKFDIEDAFEVRLPYFNKRATRMKKVDLGIPGVCGVKKEGLARKG